MNREAIRKLTLAGVLAATAVLLRYTFHRLRAFSLSSNAGELASWGRGGRRAPVASIIKRGHDTIFAFWSLPGRSWWFRIVCPFSARRHIGLRSEPLAPPIGRPSAH